MEATRSAQEQTTIPASSWSERRLLFWIRKRGFLVCGRTTNLLISNPLGVWSLRHRRYVRRTHYHRFCDLQDDAGPVQRRYAALRGLGMLSWPEYDDRVALWRRRLADMYWDAAPPEHREAAVGHLRKVRRARRVSRLVVYPLCVVILAGIFFFLAEMVLFGSYPAWFNLLFLLVCFPGLYAPLLHLLREKFDRSDAIVQVLDKLCDI